MANKQRFFGEFEMNISQNVLFPYISALDGLERWYADEAKVIQDKKVNLVWEDEPHYAKMNIDRKNYSVQIEFLDEEKQEVDDPSVLKMTVEKNEMTNGIYLMVEDYTDLVDSNEEFQDLWDSLVDDLRDVLGA